MAERAGAVKSILIRPAVRVSALRLEGQGRRHPSQNRRRQTRARRQPNPMQLYFRYTTLASDV
jgi:hypothetical protein